MKVYFLSGLGADETVFQFLDFSLYEPVFIKWIKPLENESLEAYALRLKDAYNIPGDAIVVGLSFGGMLATELAKKYSLLQAIVISGAKTKNELPRYYQTGKYFPVYRWSTDALYRWFMLNSNWFFGLRHPKHVEIYKTLIKNANIDFNKWAVNALINWQNTTVPPNIKHIHGTHDKILPYKNISCDVTVRKGEHLMVMNYSATISQFIHEVIQERSLKTAALFLTTSQAAHPHPG